MWYSGLTTILGIVGIGLYLAFMRYVPYSFLIFIALGITTIASIGVKITAGKFHRKDVSNNMTGEEVARYILNRRGLGNVGIVRAGSMLGEYFSPSDNVIAISNELGNSRSITAYGVIAHEIGHAEQYKDGYLPIKIRAFFITAARFIQAITMFLVVLTIFGGYGIYLDFVIGSLALTVLVQMFTLPLEINASIRAYKMLLEYNLINENEGRGVKKVLKAAAYTYIASLMSSILQLVRLLMIRNSNRD